MTTDHWLDDSSADRHPVVESRSPRRAAPARLAVVVIAVAAAIASCSLPWLHAGLGSSSHTYTGAEIPELAAPMVLALVFVIVAAFLQRASQRRLPVALVASIFVAGSLALLVGVIETVDTLIPRSAVPATARRVTFALSAGPGLWTALCAATVCALATSGLDVRGRATRVASRAGERAPSLIAAIVLLVGLTAFVTWLRYQPWIGASVGHHAVALPGWALPVTGPLSLVAIWLSCAGVAFSLMTARPHASAALMVLSGWLCTVVAALPIISASWLARTGVTDLLGGSLDEMAPRWSVAPATWLTFWSGLITAAAGLVVVWSVDLRKTT